MTSYKYILFLLFPPGGLTADELNSLGPTVVSHIPDHVWLYHIDERKYNVSIVGMAFS